MGTSFGRMSGFQGNRGVARRERMLFIGGGTLLFIALMIAVVVLIQSLPVQAKPENNAQPLNEELVLGSVTLVTANTKIAKGSKITQQYLREVNWPRDQVPEGAIRKTDDVENMFALTSLPENQPILRSSISATPPSFGISESLPPGNRAVTINVNAVSGIEGWATPGAHVDVFLTYLDPKDSTNKTRVVVENAVVLSFGGSTKAPDGMDESSGTSGVNITTVTLSVPFQDAMKIQTAIALGRITLALRNANDIAPPTTNTFAATDWDQVHRPTEDKRPSPSKGYAEITLPSGERRNFVLGQDERWQSHASDDEEM